MSNLYSGIFDLAANVLLFVYGTVVGWVLYGVYKLTFWLAGLTGLI